MTSVAGPRPMVSLPKQRPSLSNKTVGLQGFSLRSRSRTVRDVSRAALPPMPSSTPAKTGMAGTYEKAAVGDTLPDAYMKFMPKSDSKRSAGIILHPTSLPGPYGIGELGSEARTFVDWLVTAGMTCWQMLPLGPPDPMFFSPYSGTDANCGNPLMISINELVSEGLLDASDVPATVPVGNVDYPAVMASKGPALQYAAARLVGDAKFKAMREEMTAFRKINPWIEDSAIFDVARNLPELSQMAWWDWPEAFRFREPEALKEFCTVNKQAIDEFIALQFLFDRQWKAIRAYANSFGIQIIGDMPIYVGGHSADVWSNQKLFELGPTGAPATVSGVPPDAFSETGQLWGSPLYKWSAHKAEGYDWWCQRMGRAMQLYDTTRIDHFRGFAGYWAIDGAAETAMGGTWCKGPGLELFQYMKEKLGAVPIIAEDLGVITADVVELRDTIEAPGMVVLQFAWGGGPDNVHLPHNHYANCFVYPGTHDNETAVGWYTSSAPEEDKRYFCEYLHTDGKDPAWDLIRASMNCVAGTCVIMMQDVMRLDNTARMNTPGRAEDNWLWRVGDSTVFAKLQQEATDLKRAAGVGNRLPPGSKFKV